MLHAHFGEAASVHASLSDEATVSYEERSDYFDELGLFTDKRNDMSARALTHVDLYKLTRDDFESVIRDYPGPSIKLADSAWYEPSG